MKAPVGSFNQEKALVGAFSVIVKTDCGTDGPICGTKHDMSHLDAIVVSPVAMTLLLTVMDTSRSPHSGRGRGAARAQAEAPSASSSVEERAG